MNKEIADKWVAALRSGKYQQGTGNLQKAGKFCCLGVLCEVMGVPKTRYLEGLTCYGTAGDRSTTQLPSVTTKAARMRSEFGTLESGETLVGLNDSGETFEEIATLIENNWRKL